MNTRLWDHCRSVRGIFRFFTSFIMACLILLSIAPEPAHAGSWGVSSHTPTANARNVSASTVVSVNFDDAINSATVDSSTFVVTGSQSGAIPGTYGTIANMAVFTPTGQYRPGETVTVTLTTGIQNTLGSSISHPCVFQFTVTAAVAPVRFPCTSNYGTGSDDTYALTTADVDNDGDLDIVVGNDSEQNTVHLNNGDGTFAAGTPFGTGSDGTRALAIGDLDGDGDPDIVVGNYNEQNVVYLNDGDGTFDTASNNFGTGSDRTTGVALGDMNGDGHLDIVVGNDSGQNVVYLNDGDGTFDTTSVNFGTGSDYTYAVALGDVNGDGHLDIVVGNDGAQNVVYLNDGDGTFDTTSNNVGTGSEYTSGMALGDVDGDGDLDLVVGNISEQDVVYLNDGDGTFDTTSYNLGTGSTGTAGLALGDVDGDGDLDVAIAEIANQNRVYLNDGDGTFDTASANFGTGSDVTAALVIGDMDGDGDLDIITGNVEQSNVVYLNSVLGVSSLAPAANTGNIPANSPVAVTFNAPVNPATISDTTFIITGSQSGSIPGSLGVTTNTATFTPTGTYRPGEMISVTLTGGIEDTLGGTMSNPYTFQYTVAAATAPAQFPESSNFGTGSEGTFSIKTSDFDGDGDMDIALGNYYTEQNAVYLNNGDGTWSAGGNPFGTGSDNTVDIATGDLDGDGDMDIAAGNKGGQNSVYLNNGDGTFAATGNPFGTGSDDTCGLAIGDVDGDGDPDLAVVNNNEQSVVYLNNGDGTFNPAGNNFGSASARTYSVALGDVDGDGDLDIAMGTWYTQNYVYLNNGDGTFAATGSPFGSSSVTTNSLAMGDFDGDGDLDIATGNLNQQNYVYFNNGDGTFAAAGNPLGTAAVMSYAIAAGDMDGDGDLDIAVGDVNYQNTVCLNNGAGTFTTSRNFGAGSDATTSLTIGDMDGDGDLDIIAGNNANQNVVYFNGLPEINLKQGSTSFADGGTYDFGSKTTGTNTDISFTVENTGTADLTLTTPLTITGADAGEFSIQTQPGTTVAPGGTGAFIVRFTPTSAGTKTAFITIPNNDSDENPYDLTLTGTGVVPEINLKQNTTDIADGGTCDFGTKTTGTDTDIVFTIESTGSTDLTVIGPLTITGADAGQFSIQAQPGTTVTPGSTTTFTVRFSPTSAGAKTATIAIANNDGDENPYDLTLTGTGVVPEINLKQNTTDIADGGTCDFGSKTTGTDTDIVFTIESTGSTDLTVIGPLTITGADAGQFSIQAQPGTTVTPGSTTTFTVRFSPTSAGAKTATIAIANNDGDENPYDLTLTGTGNVPAGGGGFVPPAAPEPTGLVTLPGTEESIAITEDGQVNADATVTSESGDVTVSILEDTVMLNAEGTGLTQISITPMDNPPAPPENDSVIGFTYDCQPNGANFYPGITITLAYDPANLPEGVLEDDLVIAWYDETANEWIDLPCTVDKTNHTVSAVVTHFTAYAVVYEIPPEVVPASFSVTDLTILPEEITPGEEVTVSVHAANTGGTIGTLPLSLLIDSESIETQYVTLNAAKEKEISFTITAGDPGTYTVTVYGLDVDFTVTPLPEEPETTVTAEEPVKPPVIVPETVESIGKTGSLAWLWWVIGVALVLIAAYIAKRKIRWD